MLRLRLLAPLAATLLALALPVAAAEPEKPAAAPEQCGGADMLTEMQTKEPETYAKVMDEAGKLENTEAILWKVEKVSVEPSYLFGTIHMSDKRVATLSEKTQAAFATAKTVALEIANTSDTALIEAMTKVPELLAYAGGSTLQAQLTPDEFKKVQALVTKTGMPADAAVVLKPWLISMLMSISDCQRLQMAAGIEALDKRLEAEAKKRGATVVGLETAESQLAAMASVPNDQQILMLKSGLAYAERTDDMIETLVQMYLKRQIGATMPFQKALAEKTGVPASAFEGFIKMLLVDRNARMRDAMKPLFDKGQAFVAVGALHLSGKTGLVALLRETGYTVTAVE
jgi:uncharacterized protein YbaP (TraB family)